MLESDEEEIEKSDIEDLRRKNIEERNAFLQKFINDPLFANTIKGLKSLKEDTERSEKKFPTKGNTKRKRDDSLFKFTGSVPRERRSSARLQNKKPDYSHTDLPDEKYISRDPDDLNWNDLEEVVYEVKQNRKSAPRNSTPAKIIPVEEVTEEMIRKIQTSGNKVYGQNGTSCHQCRQKTIDTKTICRSGFCIGVKGQFCGICVINRYGEDPVKALKDPNWKCYVCRGCCNCSFCRAKAGKRPTGILAPLAKLNGYKSVMDFLQSLNGYGDFVNPQKDPENLLGFDGDEAVLGNYKRKKIKCNFLCEALPPENKFNVDEVLHYLNGAKDPENLLGFDGDKAILGGNKCVEIKSSYNIEDFKKIVKP